MASTEGDIAVVATTMALKEPIPRAEDSQEYDINGTPAPSSRNSQTTADGQEGTFTPPTSDGLSSQSTGQEGQLSQFFQLSQVASVQPPVGGTEIARQSSVLTAGQKRTADGQVKQPSHSPKSRGNHGSHSRNASTVSTTSSSASKIGELSSELRTRLSYAMVKVNNGWQANSIDEVESLASQVASPTSSNSTLHGRANPVRSPRTIMASLQGNTPRQSFAATPTGDFDLYGKGEPVPQRTYESFWRDHPMSTAQQQRQQGKLSVTPPPAKITLAPPPDIRPVPQSRRSDPRSAKHPTLPSAPRTPSRPQELSEARLQTPSQKTIQEQDAIETLLFMSSPGNSGNMGPAHQHHRVQAGSPPQASPLRAEFQHQHVTATPGSLGRKIAFQKVAEGFSPARRSTQGRTVVQRKDAIDKLLDDMADNASSDEEDVLLYANPSRRRIATGRV